MSPYSVSTSMILPLPSSPHWAPTRIVFAIIIYQTATSPIVNQRASVTVDDRHHGPRHSQPTNFSAAPDVHNKNPRMKIRGKGAGLCVKKLGTQRANVNSRPG